MSADTTDSAEPARRVAALADDLIPYYKRYENAQDSRAVFAYAYYTLTSDLAATLDAPDEFDDPAWVADLALAFGRQYVATMDAIDDWQRDATTDPVDESLEETVPRPWADVYRAICLHRSTVLEDLVFAMAAHITYDLPHALLDVGLDPDHVADYHRMNDVLASRTDAVQTAVTGRYNRTIGRLDRVVGETDEYFTNYWIRIGRSVAWYNAVRLQSPPARPQAEGSIDRATRTLIESTRRDGPLPVRLGFTLYRTILPLARQWPESHDAIQGTDE